MSKDDLSKLDEQVAKMFNDAIDVCIEEYYSKESKESLYESIEDYKKKTGKRFRRTKDQMARGLTVEDSFAEFLESDQS
tara:strand:+ start:1081 stop:1317 length:237 start_codon:yes stop_codon:yes gene_type:complete